MTLERRTFASEVEARTKGENTRVIHGYAYKFRSLSQVLGSFREQVIEGAGRDSIGSDDIRALYNHDANYVLGRNLSGTLRMTEDSTGLEYEITADERQSYVRDLLVALERGDINQSSFGFRVASDGQEWDNSGDVPLRSITKMSLFDVSPVTYPAYLSSESGVSKRALDHAASLVEEKRDDPVKAFIAPGYYDLPIDPQLAAQILRNLPDLNSLRRSF
jgi:HK97 family phage prohead protease